MNGFDGMMLCLILLYNTFITIGLVLFWPLLLALVAASEKRRQTFGFRMGWSGGAWGTAARNRKAQRIWVHALSVGEVLAAQPMTTALITGRLDAEIFFTASTLTGYQTACRLFSGQSIHVGYFPYDWIWSVRQAISKIDPTHVIVTETDIWPTFLWELRRRRVPVFLVNLRISDRTWKNYAKFKWIAKKVYAFFHGVCVQTEKEMFRLVELGVPSRCICITGNLKFDSMGISTDAKSVLRLRNRLNISEKRRLIVAGSTHEGEEAILCEALRPILSQDRNLTLVVAPRDPRRSRPVVSLYRQNGLRTGLLSHLEGRKADDLPQVVVIDAIGVLKALYGLAYLTFIGGSMRPFGGHNPLEPAFWGKPVLFGSDMRDFALIAQYLTKAGGAVCVTDVQHLRSVVEFLLKNPVEARKMGEKALGVLLAHQGAVDRTLSFLNLKGGCPTRHPSSDLEKRARVS